MTILHSLTVLIFAAGCCGNVVPVAAWQSTSAQETAEIRGDVNRSDINVDALYQHWVHSSEEQQPGGKDLIYRPTTFKKFPPSRFRMEYKFSRNGDCEWLSLSPDDAHRFKMGKWILDPTDKTLLRIITDGTTASFRIATLWKELLRLVPIETKPNK